MGYNTIKLTINSCAKGDYAKVQSNKTTCKKATIPG